MDQSLPKFFSSLLLGNNPSVQVPVFKAFCLEPWESLWDSWHSSPSIQGSLWYINTFAKWDKLEYVAKSWLSVTSWYLETINHLLHCFPLFRRKLHFCCCKVIKHSLATWIQRRIERWKSRFNTNSSFQVKNSLQNIALALFEAYFIFCGGGIHLVAFLGCAYENLAEASWQNG